MNNLIEIRTNDKQEQVVSARELYEALGLDITHWSRWYQKNIIEDEFFKEGIDYVGLALMASGNQRMDFAINLDMAKELCMLARTEKGKEIRKYFIEVEKEWNSPESVMARGLQFANKQLLECNVKIEQLENKIEEQKPKVLFADCVAGSRTSILVRDLAKLLRQNGMDIGEKRLYERLRKTGYLTLTNKPTQKSMDLGLFEIKEGHYINSVGASVTTLTPKVTGQGQIYFINKFLKEIQNNMEV